jgi:hypothetical protein
MNYTPRPLPKHHRARLIAWALAMLAWVASLLFGGAVFTDRHARQRGKRMSLAGLKYMVECLILSRARDFARLRWRGRHVRAFRGRPIAPRAVVRALIGARVRRMLKRRTIAERIAVFIQALTQIDTYATLLAKRVRRGLTRRLYALFIPPIAPAAPCASLALMQAAFSDSS